MTGVTLLIVYAFILICIWGVIAWQAGRYGQFYGDDVNLCVLALVWPAALIPLIFIGPFYLIFKISKKFHGS